MATAAQQPAALTAPPAALSNVQGRRFPSRHAISAAWTDSELMRLVALGDQDAFMVVYDTHAHAALGAALRMIRNREAAEEIVQEAFVKLWRSPGIYNAARGSLRTFVLVMVRHRALDALRSQAVRSRRNTSDAGFEQRHEAPELTDVEATRREEAASVRAAVGRLPQGQSLVIELAYFAGLSHREIAAQLAMPIGTVKGRIRLGIEKLRGEFAG